MEDNDGEDTSGIDSDYDHKEEEFEDEMDNFVRAYHTFRGAKKLFANKHILNTVTVHAHLEYEDHFAGTTHGATTTTSYAITAPTPGLLEKDGIS